jgi:predicted ATPase
MISEVTLKNFQCFGDLPQSFELRPITLVFGPNGAGKSTLQRALRLLAQSLKSSSSIQFNGELINLVSAPNVIHKHQDDRNLEIQVKIDVTSGGHFAASAVMNVLRSQGFDVSDSPIQSINTNWKINRFGVTEAIRLGFISDEPGDGDYYETRNITFQNSTDDEGVHPWRFGDEENGYLDTRRFLVSVQKHVSEIIDHNAFIEGVLEEEAEADYKWLEWLNPVVAETIDTLNNRFEENFDLTSDGPMFGESNFWDFIPTKGASHEALLNKYFEWHWSALRESLAMFEYVGPLREIPELLQISNSNYRWLGSDRDISSWLEKLTDGRYSYKRDYTEISGFGTGTFSITEYVVDNHTDGVRVRFQDVGVGLSQVVPVLNALFRTRRNKGDSSVLMLEQPELHLHPRMQGHVMDAIIHAVSSGHYWQQIVAETHSESMVLRLQRRIAEGTLDPELVSILYVDSAHPDSNFEQVRRLHLDDAGNFVEPWPESFTDLRLNERGFGGRPEN